MTDGMPLQPPPGFDWRKWVDRWDRMQCRYLVRRDERFELIARTIGETLTPVRMVLDLGCGPGSLSLRIAAALPDVDVIGIDFDPGMLLLARLRLAEPGGRVKIIAADLRDASWTDAVPTGVDAVVSATALHWMTAAELAALYRQIARVLRPGGLFLNADHVASDSPAIQQARERHREQMRRAEARGDADDWGTFWREYGRALGVDLGEINDRVPGGWQETSEAGLPHAWHLDELRAAGFSAVDCFWRSDCDAVYGGLRS